MILNVSEDLIRYAQKKVFKFNVKKKSTNDEKDEAWLFF